MCVYLHVKFEVSRKIQTTQVRVNSAEIVRKFYEKELQKN